MTKDEDTTQQQLIDAYERMMQRVRKEALPELQQRIDAAREKAIELGELTREEAERIGDYLRRDLQDAADYLVETGAELKDWLQFDMELIEDRLRDMLEATVDRTREELDALAERARIYGEIHTGEIVGPSTLVCSECRQELHFHATSHVPPCPKCHHTRFKRAAAD